MVLQNYLYLKNSLRCLTQNLFYDCCDPNLIYNQFWLYKQLVLYAWQQKMLCNVYKQKS